MEKHYNSSSEGSVTTDLPHFLADTWWFGMSSRLSEEDFIRLVKLRQEQGFSAAQVVVGVPPEVGPMNDNAMSDVGFPWNLKGAPNKEYLNLARARIKVMNEHGITGIVYGAWGHQIDWIGVNRMKEWWSGVIDSVDDLDVIYSLTGESDLWPTPQQQRALLPDKTTDDIVGGVKTFGARALGRFQKTDLFKKQRELYLGRRRKKWSRVLATVAMQTDRPILVHTSSHSSGFESVDNTDLLCANTFQTGHSRKSEARIWQSIHDSRQVDPEIPAINLEPWYEGINHDFYQEDQLSAYWLSVAAGAHAVCYGAHGVWNAGDGNFLKRWGGQTFEEALELETPRILGEMHRKLHEVGVFSWGKSISVMQGKELVALRRFGDADDLSLYYIREESYLDQINVQEVIFDSNEYGLSAEDQKRYIVVLGRHIQDSDSG